VECWSTKAAISLKRIKIEEKLLWKAYRKSSTLFQFFGSPPYFYFRFRLYGHRDSRFCVIFASTAQRSVLDGTNGFSSSKPCAYCRIVQSHALCGNLCDSTASLFTGRMPFLPPNQQHQSTEAFTIIFIVTFANAVSLMQCILGLLGATKLVLTCF